MSDLTRHLQRIPDDASDHVAVAALYDEIRRLARALMRHERPGHTLLPTALANEAYLRLFGEQVPQFVDSEHFLSVAITTLRRILVEHGRRRRSQKRGGGVRHVEIDDEQIAAAKVDERILALDESLRRLAELDPLKARLVELRFFGGLEVAEAAHLCRISPRTAAREWRVARAFLRAGLLDDGVSDGLDP